MRFVRALFGALRAYLLTASAYLHCESLLKGTGGLSVQQGTSEPGAPLSLCGRAWGLLHYSFFELGYNP